MLNYRRVCSILPLFGGGLKQGVCGFGGQWNGIQSLLEDQGKCSWLPKDGRSFCFTNQSILQFGTMKLGRNANIQARVFRTLPKSMDQTRVLQYDNQNLMMFSTWTSFHWRSPRNLRRRPERAAKHQHSHSLRRSRPWSQAWCGEILEDPDEFPWNCLFKMKTTWLS